MDFRGTGGEGREVAGTPRRRAEIDDAKVAGRRERLGGYPAGARLRMW
jgi:hypothetical protein